MSRWDPTEALIQRDFANFVMMTVRLMIRHDGAYLRADGSWQTVEEGTALDDGFGLVIPIATVEAIAVAIAEFQGHSSHADTEARVLRESLTIERERVDRILAERAP